MFSSRVDEVGKGQVFFKVFFFPKIDQVSCVLLVFAHTVIFSDNFFLRSYFYVDKEQEVLYYAQREFCGSVILMWCFIFFQILHMLSKELIKQQKT